MGVNRDILIFLGFYSSCIFKILGLNKTQLSQQLGLSLPTLNKYLWYLEQTFIIKSVRPWRPSRVLRAWNPLSTATTPRRLLLSIIHLRP